MISFSMPLGGYGRCAGLFFIFLSIISFPLVYFCSLRIAPEPANGHSVNNACRAVLLGIAAVALSLILYSRISSIFRDPTSLPLSDYEARVEEVTERRYDKQALLLFRKAGTDRNGPFERKVRCRGIAYLSGESDLNAGDIIKFRSKPVSVAHPIEASPFHRSLLARGIHYLIYLRSSAFSVAASEKTARKSVREALSANCDALFNKDTSSVVKALYFGNQNYISKRILNDFKRAGVLHVLSASGLHVGIVAAILLFVLTLFRLNKKFILAASAIAITMYLYITDMPVSLVRSAIMFMIYALHRAVDRDANIVNALFLSATIILGIYPHEIYGLEFQLSFGATLGILLFHQFYGRVFSFLPSKISDSLALTIAAQVPIFPVLAARIGEINIIGVMSNIVVVPAMSLLLVASLAANGVSIFTGYASQIGHVSDLIFVACKYVIGFVSELGFHYHIESVHPALLVPCALLLFPLLPWFYPRKAMSVSIVAAFIFAWALLEWTDNKAGKSRRIIHERGAVLLYRQGSGLQVIGNMPEIGRMEPLIQAIASMQCREMYLHIPDPDYANIAGYSYLAKRFPVQRCYLSGTFSLKNHTRRFFRILDRDGVELILHDFNLRPGTALGAGRTLPEWDPGRMFARYRKIEDKMGTGP